MLAGTPATAILTADIKMMLRYSCLFMVRNSWRHFFHLNFKISNVYARTCCFILNLFLFCQMGHLLEALRPTMSFWRVQMGWCPAWWLDSHRWMFSGLETGKKSLMVRAKNGNVGPDATLQYEGLLCDLKRAFWEHFVNIQFPKQILL